MSHKPLIVATKQKGGVGNTTAVVTLATAMSGLRKILIIDLDLSRSDCAPMLRLPKAPDLWNLFINGDFNPARYSENLHVLRGDITSTHLARVLIDRPVDEIQDTFIGVMEDYDLTIVDASPDTSTLRNALSALADVMLFTTATDAQGFEELFHMANKCLASHKPFVIAPTIIRDRTDARRAMSAIRNQYPNQTAPDIPDREAMRAAARNRETIWEYAKHPHPDHAAGAAQLTTAYNALISKILEQGDSRLTMQF